MPDALASLLQWYDRHARDLPWRRSRDPYHIWVSEVMLQQTRVETVLPYYQRFLAAFPTVQDLAAAPVDDLLALWSGLGYYRRARQMHAAAQRIAAAGGAFPGTVEALQELPGIGSYTAAAVASIAFGVAVPVLDGNVERVLARVLALAPEAKSSAGRQALLAAAHGLLSAERPGDSNQALMELGATICLPRRPGCGECPLAAGCQGRQAGDPERFPVRRPRRASQRIERLVAVATDNDRVLLFRRSEDSALLAGTWELPWLDAPSTSLAPVSLAAVEGALAERYGGRWQLGAVRATVRHAITFRALTVTAHEARVVWGGQVAEGPEAGWFNAREREALPLSSLVDKILRKLGR